MTAAATTADAVARLEHSRRRLRQCVLELKTNDDGHGHRAGTNSANALARSLRSIPLVGMLLDTVSNWWSQHPLRVVATWLAASTASATRPMTQRHPRLTLFAAFAAGGLLMWTRPWRFSLLRRAVYAFVLPQFVSKMLSRLPADDWLSLADSMLRRARPPSAASTTTSPVAPHPAHHRFPTSNHAATTQLH